MLLRFEIRATQIEATFRSFPVPVTLWDVRTKQLSFSTSAKDQTFNIILTRSCSTGWEIKRRVLKARSQR